MNYNSGCKKNTYNEILMKTLAQSDAINSISAMPVTGFVRPNESSKNTLSE
jgi:hypothetical protein